MWSVTKNVNRTSFDIDSTISAQLQSINIFCLIPFIPGLYETVSSTTTILLALALSFGLYL